MSAKPECVPTYELLLSAGEAKGAGHPILPDATQLHTKLPLRAGRGAGCPGARADRKGKGRDCGDLGLAKAQRHYLIWR